MIELRGISKHYDGAVALNEIDLEIRAGEVHAICGENGAGKSTLNRILAGSVVPDSGTVTLDGNVLRFGSVHDTEAAGIVIVHQESAAFLHLSATENHQIMMEPCTAGGFWIDRKEMRVRAEASLKDIGEEFDVDRPLLERSVAQRQMVAIARALSSNCKLFILDEPTASLSKRESEALFAAVRSMRERGVAIIYVTHRLEEVFLLSDRVTILRDGKKIVTLETKNASREELIRHMVGREIGPANRQPAVFGEVGLEVKNLSKAGAFTDISFKVHRGEIVVLTGLIGAGRSEVARAIFGLDISDSGEILGANRVGFVPEDRQHEGLHTQLSIRENTAMAIQNRLLIQRVRERQESEKQIANLSIKTESDLNLVSSLSGGNQQKVLLAKWLSTNPDILILDEPTRGVDVGAKEQIHQLIHEFAERGGAVLVISSDMPEVLSLADRILVMRQGTLSGEILSADATQDAILQLALPLESASQNSEKAKSRRAISQETVVASLIVLVGAIATLTNPSFFTWTNLSDILVKVAPVLIVGTLMTLVIFAREIDISVGSLMGLCGAILGIACSTDRLGLPVAIGMLMCLCAGLVGGILNGVLTAKAKIPSIIVTLGMLTILRGITELLLGGKWIENMPSGLRRFGTEAFLTVPYSVWVAIITVLAGIWITKRTKFGLRAFAIGSNPEAALLRGIPVSRVRIGVFALTGLACGVAAIFGATQLQVVESGFGSGFELVVIASVIVGGTSIRGGKGSVLGTILGAILLGMISTVLIFLKLGESAVYWERALQGGLILLAVLGDHFWRRRSI
jgi:ABC-type sugar transport system ATPase subunit/ribose/xylose/arabinose/galactoside ABC-type transport system permease subunit